jgi:hypothetical protein
VIFTYTENDNLGNNIALGYPPPVPVASMTAVAGFREYASPSRSTSRCSRSTTKWTARWSGGRSRAATSGPTSSATRTRRPRRDSEGAVLVNGGIHAREWQTPEARDGGLRDAVAGKSDHGFFQYLVENLNTVLVPVNNVTASSRRNPSRSTSRRIANSRARPHAPQEPA